MKKIGEERNYFFKLKPFRKSSRGAILMENVVFIILNLVFLTILILFIIRQGEGAVVYEQAYAKQIALLIDSAKPGMIMIFNMESAKKISERNEVSFSEVVKINGNSVFVKLGSEGLGYSYDFFHDVDVSVYPDTQGKTLEEADSYVLKINSYNEN